MSLDGQNFATTDKTELHCTFCLWNCFSLLCVDKRVLKISNLKKSVDVMIKIRRDTQKHVLKTTSNSEQVYMETLLTPLSPSLQ